MVYVLSMEGKPLMPTNRHGKIRRLLKEGRRSIRTQRYFYQPKDIVTYDRKQYIVKGIQNKGSYIKLEGLSKPVKVELVKPYIFRKGICAI